MVLTTTTLKTITTLEVASMIITLKVKRLLKLIQLVKDAQGGGSSYPFESWFMITSDIFTTL